MRMASSETVDFFAQADGDDQPFAINFRKLFKWSREHGGTCRISEMREAGREDLADFCLELRRAYKRYLRFGKLGHSNELLTDHRWYRLEAIGFKWGRRNWKTVNWNQRMQQIEQYKQEHGSCLVTPMPNDSESMELANWVSFIKYEYVRSEFMGLDSVLTHDQIFQLKELGLL